jgi:hypothetical protein
MLLQQIADHFGIGIFDRSLSAAEARFHMTSIIQLLLFHLHFTIERSGYR